MFCGVCGGQKASDTAACDACGAAPEAPTMAAGDAPNIRTSVLPRPSQPTGSVIDHGAFTPGTLLGTRYRIVGLLGRGGMGEVYRADDLTLGQPVALKFLRGDEPTLAARLRDETRTARQVSHPNVCRVHDVAEWNGRPFVSMEYVDGEDLAALLRRIGRLPPDKAVDIVRQVCAGLAAAHDRGVLHRDLKPANVMLDGRGKVRITDFGLASFADDERRGEVAGTPAYMAPEQIAGGQLSPQTDIYAVGLLLFELIAGYPTYGARSLADRVLQGTPSPLSDSVRGAIDPRIARAIDRCLDPDAARRPESALRLAATLPGGDPLAAALAAGETPAPHVVAGAADEHLLSPAVAIACVIAFGIAVIALLAVTGINVYSRYVPFPYSPEVLAARAEEVRAHCGYIDTPVDRAYGFTTHLEYLKWQRARAAGSPDWSSLHAVRPQVIGFWYRSSPRPLARPVVGRIGQITATTAEPIEALGSMSPDPDGVYVELAPDGALSSLLAWPVRDETTRSPGTAIDWTPLFREARLDPSAFSPVDTMPAVPTPADTRAAWVGPSPDGSGVTLRIEAAMLGGRPVYFRIVAPWTPSTSAANAPVGSVWLGTLFLLLVVIAAGLARRNLRKGRSDQRGGFRVALSIGLMMLAAQLLSAHHTFTGDEVFVLIGALTWALFVAAAFWLSYVALEPYVRRHWPHALVAWSRLLAGGWRDRRVGRDLLIGAMVGLASVVIERVALVVAGWRTGDSVIWRVDLDALSSGAALMASSLRALAMSTAFSIELLFLLLLLRMFSPRPWMASILAISIVAGMDIPTFTDAVVQLPFAVLSATVLVLFLTRYGLLAGIASLFVAAMSVHVIASLDSSPFFVRTMIAGILLLSAPALIGFYISMAGRSLAGTRFDLQEVDAR